MSVRSFIDTNVLIYADASDEPIKQARAIAVIREHRLAHTGVVSTQVLQEFIAAAICKLGLPPELIRERVAFYSGFEVVNASTPLIMAALDTQVLHRLSFWDAMIVQAAREASCAVLLSEDLQTDATLSGVRIVNPFA
ncbi:MAG TPA: twitching motility protein PilT [Gammaproteobacteria bacterium]|nr:twitching motility protein PilT [Gammaproteobacteria bacterium]